MSPDTPPTFSELVASRREWISNVLVPWCHTAVRTQLRLAELEWTDIAGKVAPEKTLWFWAWSRFPELVHTELQGIDETFPVRVILKDGSEFIGHPDARESTEGSLVLIGKAETGKLESLGPYSIDDIAIVQRIEPPA